MPSIESETREPSAASASARRVPLSEGQFQLWSADQLGGHRAGYLVSLLLRLDGELSVAALRAAITRLLARHEVLRMSVQVEGDSIFGVVAPPAHFELPLDVIPPDTVDVVAEVDRRVAVESAAAMDISSELPIRGRLLQVTADQHVLCLVIHHLVFDNWSRQVLCDDLGALYAAELRGDRVEVLAPLEVSYAEFTAEQALGQRSGGDDEVTEFWRDTLDGVVPFELPPERPRPARRAGEGGATTTRVDVQTVSRLAAIANEQHASLAMLLFTGCQVALRHFSGRDDITLGTTVADRAEARSEGLIGPLINSVVLRGDTSGDPSFSEAVGRMRDVALDAYDHANMTFTRLVEELAPPRDASRTPLFQVMVGFGSGRRSAPQLEGLTATELLQPAVGCKYDLVIWFDHCEDGSVLVDLGWDIALYTETTMQRLLAHLAQVLLAASSRPLSPISALTPQPALDWAAIRRLATGPDTGHRARCLHEYFEDWVERTPDATAIVAIDGSSCSYFELDQMAERVARHLGAAGVGPETLVGVLARRSVELIGAILGILKCGGAFVPLDPEHPLERLAYLVDDTAASLIIGDDDLLATLPSASAEKRSLHELVHAEAVADDSIPSSASPKNIAYVIYTSGTTGQPKGVAVPHESIAHRIASLHQLEPLDGSDALLLKAPFSFDASVSELFWPLASGARVVMSATETQTDPAELCRVMAERQITVSHFIPPSMLGLVLVEPDLRRCEALRLALPGGEVVPPVVVAEFLKLMPETKLYNAYGPTEAAVYASWWRCTPDCPTDSASIPLGAPLGDTEAWVLDEQLRPVPAGAVGELCLGGAGLARGYLNAPRVTADRFVPHPFSEESGSRIYRTGDLVRMRADGISFEFLGRMDEQVKVRGFRIELTEVESTLVTHADISTATATLLTQKDGDRRLVAYAVANDGSEPTSGALRDYLADHLPSHAVPATVVLLDELPRLNSGKIDRRSLPAPTEVDWINDIYVEPRTESEQLVAKIWAEVLSDVRPGVTDNFFAIGGHSLLAIRVINHLKEHVMLELPVSLIFENPTVATLAASLDREAAAASR